jgi:acetyl esterase
VVADELVPAPEPSGLPPVAELLRPPGSELLIAGDGGVTEALRQASASLSAVETTPVELGEHAPARLYRGPAVAQVPLLVWAHGGGFLGGDLDMAEAHWVALSLAAAGVNVLSVDYRKAVGGVEYPAPYEDLLTAWRWAFSHASDLAWGKLHIGGASAGASLAASVALRLRDDAKAPPASVVLAYPTLHSELPSWRRSELDVMRERAGRTYFSAQWIADMGRNYLGAGGPDAGRYAFPGEADLRNLPPHLLLLAEFDTLRSSGERYAESLAHGGVAVDRVLVEDAIHGFLNDPASAAGRTVPSEMARWIAAHS